MTEDSETWSFIPKGSMEEEQERMLIERLRKHAELRQKEWWKR